MMSSFTTVDTSIKELNVEKITSELIKPIEFTISNYINEATNSLEEFGICAITLTVYNQDGEVVSQNTFYLEAYSEIHCAQLAGAFRRFVQQN